MELLEKNKALIYQLFKNKSIVTADDLHDCFLKFSPDLSRRGTYSKIYNLRQEGILTKVGRGIYELKNNIKAKKYDPTLLKGHLALYHGLKKKFKTAQICIWPVNWIHGFMVHQPFSNWLIVEPEKDAMEAVFYELKETKKHVFLNPSKKEIDYYISGEHESIIVKPLVTEAPLIEKKDVLIPSLEKIFVDLFVDKELYLAYQGKELDNIIKNVFETFPISLSTLFRYSKRRGHFDTIISCLEQTVIQKKDAFNHYRTHNDK